MIGVLLIMLDGFHYPVRANVYHYALGLQLLPTIDNLGACHVLQAVVF